MTEPTTRKKVLVYTPHATLGILIYFVLLCIVVNVLMLVCPSIIRQKWSSILKKRKLLYVSYIFLLFFPYIPLSLCMYSICLFTCFLIHCPASVTTPRWVYSWVTTPRTALVYNDIYSHNMNIVRISIEIQQGHTYI